MREYERWDSLLQYWSERFGVPLELARRQMMAESSGDPNAVSGVGAVGLFQLMPGTAWELKVRDRRNPDENIRAGLEYLARMRTAVSMTVGKTDLLSPEDHWRLAVASYNCGFAYVRKALRVLLDRKTERVTWDEFRTLLGTMEIRKRRPRIWAVNDYVMRVVPLGVSWPVVPAFGEAPLV